MEEQRQIKFRFWNKIARRFQPDGMYSIIGNGKLLGYDYEIGTWEDEVEFKHSCIIAQQFTGLKDSQEKEIYEGDIVLTNAPFSRHGFFSNQFIIVFEYGKFRLKYKSGDMIDLSPFDIINNVSTNELKIIGNIFENSDLLK